MSSDHYYRSVYSLDFAEGPTTGRLFGGLAVLWRKSLAPFISYVDLADERVIGISIHDPNAKVDRLVLGIYLPYEKCSNRELYSEYLGKLSSIRQEWEHAQMCIIGD